MLHKLRSRIESEKGFTLIELLVVILIIGILAAIAIPSFLNQRNKGYDAAAKSDVRTAQTAEETYRTDNNAYTGTVSDLTNIEPTLSSANALSAAATPTNGFTVAVTSKGSNAVVYKIVNDGSGGVTRTCLPVNKDGCPASGSW